MNKEVIDSWVEGRRAKIGLDRRKIAVFREAAGITSWKHLMDRAGLTQWLTPSDPEEDESNVSMGNWLRMALAVGRHPFDIGYIILPDSFGSPPPPEWPEIVFNADREIWGFENEEIEGLLDNGEARFAMDRRKIAVYRQAAGIDTWKGLSALSGVNVHTLQTLSKPESNPTCSTWLRVALALRVHPYTIAEVRLPGVKPQREIPATTLTAV